MLVYENFKNEKTLRITLKIPIVTLYETILSFCCYGYLRHNAGQRFLVGIHICTNLARYNKFLDSDKDCFDIRQYLVNKINKSPSLH